MQLQKRGWQSCCHRAPQHRLNSLCLLPSCCDQHNRLSTQDGSHTDRKRLFRNSSRDASKRAAVLDASRLEQADPMRARLQRIARLIEPDVTIHADSEQQQAQSTDARNGLLVALALGVRLSRKPVETMGSLRVEIDA